MSVRGPDDGREVLSHGGDNPPRRVHRALLVVAAATLAVTGYLVTSRQEPGPAAPATVPTPSPTSSAAPVASEGSAARPLPVTVPGRRQLAGVWLVDRGPSVSWPRGMWLKLRLDGTFTFDPGRALFTGTPWARGRYRLDGADLALAVTGGRACRAGDILRWQVGLTPDDRLVTEHVTDNGGRCRVTRGEVWSARPLGDHDIGHVEGIG